MSKDTVKKDNVLVNAAYTLPLAEQRLILMAVASAAGQPDALRDMSVHAKEYAERFNVTASAAYKALGEATKNLFERRFSYQRVSEKGALRHVVSRWVQRVEYGESEGLVKLRFADDVIPLLCDLQSRFTYYALEQVANLTSVHAVRLYELLIAWRSTGQTPVFEIADFRQRLGIEPSDYPRMTDFKRRVLDAAVAQINEHTDIKVSYEQSKRGRTICGLAFNFTLKKKNDPGSTPSDAQPGKQHRQVISYAEACKMAPPGKSWADFLREIGSKYYVKGLPKELAHLQRKH